MLEILLRGVGVGLAVAAPVGPIGLLCIRRSLERGFAAGFASGLGAATADGLYGLVVAAGFAATGLLAYQAPMRLFGGTLIALLGAQAVRGFLRPLPAQAAQGPDAGGIAAAWFTTFLLTLSNPMTILAFIGLVAGLSTGGTDGPLAPYLLVAGVFTGSALWWLTLATAASVARRRLTPRLLHGLDLVSGLVLIGWGAWIFIAALG